MNELALFAGAGGGILGGSILGWRTVCAVERDAYCAQVLAQRQNDGALPAFPIWSDVSSFDGGPWRGIVDVVSGGFPCQDISEAGNGAGIDGSRSGLWREMARIVREVRPRYVLVENSRMLVRRGLARVIGEFTAMGFDCRWGVLGAIDVGANHNRKRTWIVAYSVRNRRGIWPGEQITERRCSSSPDSGSDGEGRVVADANGPREQQPVRSIREERRRIGDGDIQAFLDANGDEHEGQSHARRRQRKAKGEQELPRNPDRQGLAFGQSKPSYLGQEQSSIERADWWLTEPDMGLSADGLAERLGWTKPH